jgi:hypothetical protein
LFFLTPPTIIPPIGRIRERPRSPAAIREQGRAEVARLVEDAQDACAALWRGDADDDETGGAIVARASASASSAGHVDAYPEARMVHLLSMIGRQLVWYWTDNLTRAHGNAASSASSSGPSSSSSSSSSTATGLLFDPLPEVRQSLAAALKVLAQWDGAVAEFMHAWTAGSGGARWQGARCGALTHTLPHIPLRERKYLISQMLLNFVVAFF